MEGIVNLHHDIMFVIVVIGVFVGYLMVRAVQLFSKEIHPEADRVVHGTALEIFWKVLPVFIILILTLYFLNDIHGHVNLLKNKPPLFSCLR